MNMVQQAKQRAEFEQVLLSHAEMCYSVAFALTRNPRRAQELARYALTWAWCTPIDVDSSLTIKQKLLTTLRQRFLQHYRQSPSSPTDPASCGKDVVVE